jgi:hypothetical protein
MKNLQSFTQTFLEICREFQDDNSWFYEQDIIDEDETNIQDVLDYLNKECGENTKHILLRDTIDRMGDWKFHLNIDVDYSGDYEGEFYCSVELRTKIIIAEDFYFANVILSDNYEFDFSDAESLFEELQDFESQAIAILEKLN